MLYSASKPANRSPLRSADGAARRSELAEHPMDEAGRRTWRIRVRVREIERLPLEGAELMEGLHLHPLDISHGATNCAMPSTFAGSSVHPGTRVNRTQTRLPRDYDAKFGRWVSKDPICLTGGVRICLAMSLTIPSTESIHRDW